MYSFDEVKKTDSQVADAITAEMERQNSHIELIASENWVSKAVMAAMGSPMTNKYAEGYPAKRYYGGCECVDIVENLAIARERAVWLRVRECTAALWRTGKYGSAVLYVGARRYRDGYELRPRRTFDTWKSCEFFRHIF